MFGRAESLYLDAMIESVTEEQRAMWLDALRRKTGQDFGYDVAEWGNRIRSHPYVSGDYTKRKRPVKPTSEAVQSEMKDD